MSEEKKMKSYDGTCENKFCMGGWIFFPNGHVTNCKKCNADMHRGKPLFSPPVVVCNQEPTHD